MHMQKLGNSLKIIKHFIFHHTAQKIKLSIKDFLSKCDKIHNFLGIRSHFLKKSLMENFIFCEVSPIVVNYFWKELHKRCFTGLQTSLCSLNKKFSCKNFFWKVKKSCLSNTCATNYKWTLRKLNPSTLFLPVFLLFHCTKIMFCRKDFLSKCRKLSL